MFAHAPVYSKDTLRQALEQALAQGLTLGTQAPVLARQTLKPESSDALSALAEGGRGLTCISAACPYMWGEPSTVPEGQP